MAHMLRILCNVCAVVGVLCFMLAIALLVAQWFGSDYGTVWAAAIDRAALLLLGAAVAGLALGQLASVCSDGQAKRDHDRDHDPLM